jgi:hypothetical protein
MFLMQSFWSGCQLLTMKWSQTIAQGFGPQLRRALRNGTPGTRSFTVQIGRTANERELREIEYAEEEPEPQMNADWIHNNPQITQITQISFWRQMTPGSMENRLARNAVLASADVTNPKE